MNGFDSDALAEAIVSSDSPQDRFNALTAGLGNLGLDVVNYGFFNAAAAESIKTDINFMTTMTDDWMDHYVGQGLANTDSHVLRVVAGKLTPYYWGESQMLRLAAEQERRTALEGAEAGLRSALCVPLTSPLDPLSPVAGIVLGSSMREDEFKRVTREHGAELLSIAYLFHNVSIRQIWLDLAGGKHLTTRELDCLRYLADGLRQDAIADAMGLARISVETHLRRARVKLAAKTLSEAVARAVVFGVIKRG